MYGERSSSYSLRMLKPIQKFSADFKDVDLLKLPADAFAVADRMIRADAYKVGVDPRLMQQHMPGNRLREIRRTDQSGRSISEFVGPVSETLAPFSSFRCFA